MRVSSKAHYGLRMMTEFAKAYGTGPLSIAEVARVEHLPLAYLEHLVARLRRAELIESRRGAHGGYLLARGADQIPENFTGADYVHRRLAGGVTAAKRQARNCLERNMVLTVGP